MDNIHSKEVKTLRTKNAFLLAQSTELKKMVDLLQENLELRCSLRDHEILLRSLPPLGKACPNIPYKREDVQETPCRDPTYLQLCKGLTGDIAFQLERRILAFVFKDLGRYYGFSVANIEEKILQSTYCPVTNKVDEKLRDEMNQRYAAVMKKLKKLNYNPSVHPNFSEYLVNTYGILTAHPVGSELASYKDPKILRKMVADAVSNDVLEDVYILLNCLIALAKEDGKPILSL
ncbi:speriolin-like protein [Pseudophryne corroboree]|uniref:speriolin-like protein n=1 Tax=Pseudophryne corroboree TaxID=495146 RepID=UPI003081C20F